MQLLGTESAFEVLAKARALEAAGMDVVHLEIGEPDAATPDHVVAAGQEALARGLTHYVPAPGTLELRTAVAAFLERTGRLRTTPDRVVVTPGAKPIMFFTILALCQPGDEVLYPDPGFPMYESIAAFAGPDPSRCRCTRPTGSGWTRASWPRWSPTGPGWSSSTRPTTRAAAA
jgi:aspartate aminotransferase